jgi:hypothetical protein
MAAEATRADSFEGSTVGRLSNPPQSGVDTCDDQAGHGAQQKGKSPVNERIRHTGRATARPAGEPSRAGIRGRAVGVVVLAYFALAWTGWGMSAGVPAVVEVPVIVVAVLCFALCVLAVCTALLAPVTGIPALWTLIPGVGAARTLYVTAALLLRHSDAT